MKLKDKIKILKYIFIKIYLYKIVYLKLHKLLINTKQYYKYLGNV